MIDVLLVFGYWLVGVGVARAWLDFLLKNDFNDVFGAQGTRKPDAFDYYVITFATVVAFLLWPLMGPILMFVQRDSRQGSAPS